jgi:hypothetical protein
METIKRNAANIGSGRRVFLNRTRIPDFLEPVSLNEEKEETR